MRKKSRDGGIRRLSVGINLLFVAVRIWRGAPPSFEYFLRCWLFLNENETENINFPRLNEPERDGNRAIGKR